MYKCTEMYMFNYVCMHVCIIICDFSAFCYRVCSDKYSYTYINIDIGVCMNKYIYICIWID